MYVCPDCKTPLKSLRCDPCGRQYGQVDGIPILVSHDSRFQAVYGIREIYDDIYHHHSNAWENQGRTAALIRYFSQLLAPLSARKMLEIGCGEGFCLAAARADEKWAIDLSAGALQRARVRNPGAHLSVALAERLPFPSESFGLVTSIGVMEHFLDDRQASREILRVLEPGGYYAALIHVDMGFRELLAQKLAEYLFPHFRPLRLIRYLWGKVWRPIHQPIQNRYTVEGARACLAECGFRDINDISRRTHPDVPLVGPHVIIYIGRK